MDTQFLRQMMLAKLDEFKMYHKLYNENTINQIEFIKQYIDDDHKKEFYEFELERPDLIQWSDDMIQEIHVRTKMLHGFYLHALENYNDNHKDHAPLVMTHNKVIVRRHRLPHGTVILSIGYNPVDKVLDVEYKDGRVYRYFNVPKAISNLIREENTGAFINKMIKNKYEYILLSEAEV